MPLLRRNLEIFDSYGPGHDDSDYAERYAGWLQFEGVLIVNNRKLAMILKRNEELLHKENRGIVETFILHTDEFHQDEKEEA